MRVGRQRFFASSPPGEGVLIFPAAHAAGCIEIAAAQLRGGAHVGRTGSSDLLLWRSAGMGVREIVAPQLVERVLIRWIKNKGAIFGKLCGWSG